MPELADPDVMAMHPYEFDDYTPSELGRLLMYAELKLRAMESD